MTQGEEAYLRRRVDELLAANNGLIDQRRALAAENEDLKGKLSAAHAVVHQCLTFMSDLGARTTALTDAILRYSRS